jgi:hypothetical protein
MATPHHPHWQWLPTPRSGRRYSGLVPWVICLLLLWAAALVWALEAGSADEAEEPEFELIDVLVTRTALPGTNVQLGYRFERSSERLAAGSATTHTNEPFVTGSLAVTEWLQVSAGLPYDFLNTRSPGEGTVTTNGVGDLATEAQVAFFQNKELQFALAGGLGLGLPTGSVSKGIGGQWTLTPFLSAGKIWGPVQVLADFGYQAELRNMPDRQQRLRYDLAVGYPVLDSKLFPFLELNGAYTFTGPGYLRRQGQVVLTPGVRVTPGGWLPIEASREPLRTAEPLQEEKLWWERLSVVVGWQLPVTVSRDLEWALTTAFKLEF